MTKPKIVPEFKVDDLAGSLAFYIDVLGFSVAYARPEEAFAYLEREGAHLMLEEPHRSRTFGVIDGGHPYGQGMHLQIEVSDVAALWAAVEGASAPVVHPLEDRWYRRDDQELGNRQFVTSDPDGYLLRFFEDLGARPANLEGARSS